MLRKNQKNPPAPKKPKAPVRWEYEKEVVLDFFWDWLAADYDPRFTADNRPWFDQDPEWVALLEYVKALWVWAEYRAERPTMKIRRGDQGMADI